MALDATKIRSSVRSVIDTYGSTITIVKYVITSDKWGDTTEGSGTSTPTIGVPYDIFIGRFNFQKVGGINDGDLTIIVKDDEDIDTVGTPNRYRLTYNSVNYKVVSVEDYDLADVTLAKQIICKKEPV